MQTMEVQSLDGVKILEQLHVYLNGTIREQWGETILEFDGKLGKGTIRSITFDWGVSLVDYDVTFTEDLTVRFAIENSNPIEFIFISDGSLSYQNEEIEDPRKLERYQNIIVASRKFSKETFVFPQEVNVKANFIYIIRNEYAKKKNNNLQLLSNSLFSAFQTEDAETSYNHIGNFNLKIADQIRQLQQCHEHGIVRSLSIEGQLNLILAMQMLEEQNYVNKESFPYSLSKSDIKKINDLTGYILDNISESLTVHQLSTYSGLSPKELQLGFQVLYSRSVNEYVRQIKLEVARDYIKSTEDSISEIVYKIGFKSRSYFSKIFFEKYGILPTDYRKKLKAKN